MKVHMGIQWVKVFRNFQFLDPVDGIMYGCMKKINKNSLFIIVSRSCNRDKFLFVRFFDSMNRTKDNIKSGNKVMRKI